LGVCEAMRGAQPISVATTIGAPTSWREFIAFAKDTSSELAPRFTSMGELAVARSRTLDINAEILYDRPCFFVA
jgi:hypothetical protein